MVSERLTRFAVCLREQGIEHALLSSAVSLRYFTGYETAIESGPSPMTPLLGVFLWIRGDGPTLYLADMEPGEGVASAISTESFSSYTIERPMAAMQDLAAKLSAKLRVLPESRVAIESDDLPFGLLDSIRSKCPRLQFCCIKNALSTFRMVKDPEEIQKMREALALCDRGQQVANEAATAGRTEAEVFADIHKAMVVQEGGRVPIVADVVSGPRTALTGGAPSGRKLQAGELLLVDLAPRHHGYWGDSCNTCCIGEPRKEYREAFDGISAVLQGAIDEVRPGIRACELDNLVRLGIGKLGGSYPHHTGHGLGVSWHEEPRIVPYNQIALEPNMVIALEPGMYFEGKWGMRLEYVVRVTTTGAELLSKFRHQL